MIADRDGSVVTAGRDPGAGRRGHGGEQSGCEKRRESSLLHRILLVAAHFSTVFQSTFVAPAGGVNANSPAAIVGERFQSESEVTTRGAPSIFL